MQNPKTQYSIRLFSSLTTRFCPDSGKSKRRSMKYPQMSASGWLQLAVQTTPILSRL